MIVAMKGASLGAKLHTVKARDKIPALMAHYNIDQKSDDCWRRLALNLASDFVPCFRKRGRGRPKKPRKQSLLATEAARLYESEQKQEARNAKRAFDEAMPRVIDHIRTTQKIGTDKAAIEAMLRVIYCERDVRNLTPKIQKGLSRTRRKTQPIAIAKKIRPSPSSSPRRET